MGLKFLAAYICLFDSGQEGGGGGDIIEFEYFLLQRGDGHHGINGVSLIPKRVLRRRGLGLRLYHTQQVSRTSLMVFLSLLQPLKKLYHYIKIGCIDVFI